MEFLLYCISGFILAEIIIKILQIVFITNNLPFFVKLRTWAILSLGGLPKEYSNHFMRIGQFAVLAAMEQQLELIEKKTDAEYREFVKKFIEMNKKLVNGEDVDVDKDANDLHFKFTK